MRARTPRLRARGPGLLQAQIAQPPGRLGVRPPRRQWCLGAPFFDPQQLQRWNVATTDLYRRGMFR
jgi:hypothetical protein